ncbi:MAG: helix-turn-helix transcriptional regulator [Polyangiaceae bacterium]
MHAEVSEFELPPEVAQAVGFDLAELWEELVLGTVRVVASLYTARHCYVKLSRRVAPPPHSWRTARNHELVERSLLGDLQKCLAVDAELSASTIATALHEGLERLGMVGGPTRVPLVVVLALHRAKGSVGIPDGRLTLLGPSAERVISAPRPDFVGDGSLTPAEFDVARLKVEGKTHEEMAQLRNCSVRTIANQLGRVYSKYQVSGRFQLLSRLIQQANERSAWQAE